MDRGRTAQRGHRRWRYGDFYIFTGRCRLGYVVGVGLPERIVRKIPGRGAQSIVARFRGFDDGGGDEVPVGTIPQGESFLGRKWLIGKKIKKELDKPEGLSHTKMV